MTKGYFTEVGYKGFVRDKNSYVEFASDSDYYDAIAENERDDDAA